MKRDEYERIGSLIVEAAYEVHKELGPGLLEIVYELCLIEELKRRNLYVQNQVAFPLMYKGVKLNKNFVVDVLVENKIIIELKAVEILMPIYGVQLLSYMKLSNIKLGYLINFNEVLIKNGIKRKINGYF